MTDLLIGQLTPGLVAENRTVLQKTLQHIHNYLCDDAPTSINCLRTFLDSLCASEFCSNYIVFSRESWQEVMSSRPAMNCPSVMACCSRFLSDYSENHTSVCGFAPLDLNARCPRMHTCKGVVVRQTGFPFVFRESQVAVFLFDADNKMDLEFMALWGKLLFHVWCFSFWGKFKSFESKRANGQAKDQGDVLKHAVRIQSALRIPDVLSLFTAVRPAEQQGSDVSLPGLPGAGHRKARDGADAQEAFLSCWHGCTARPWPCDKGATFGRQMFHHYLRGGAESQGFDDAIGITHAGIKEMLTRSSQPTNLTQAMREFILYKYLGFWRTHPFTKGGPSRTKDMAQQLVQFAGSVISNAADSPEYVESLMGMTSQYAYHELKVDPRLHLASHLRREARGEPSLHMMKRFYRDHFFHTTEVCFLGHLLILLEGEGRSHRRLFGFAKEEEALRQWYIASLLHDVGYSIDMAKALRGWLGFFTDDAFTMLNKAIETGMRGMGDVDGFDRFYTAYGFKKEHKPWEDHGLMSAHHLSRLIQELEEHHKLHPTEVAVAAIAKHNCHNLAIRSKQEPLSALLVLCDTLQAWYRPRFRHFSLAPAWMMSAMVNPHGVRSLIDHGPSLYSNIRFRPRTNGQDIIPVVKPPLVLRLEFDHDVNWESAVFNIWLDAVSNLQRVDFRGLPFDVLVQIVTPFRSEEPSRQMGRLRDAIWETHMAYLSEWNHLPEADWIPTINERAELAHCLASPLCYHYDVRTRREMLSISLRRMNGQRKYVQETLDQFRQDLRRWKHYPDDLLHAGAYADWRGGGD